MGLIFDCPAIQEDYYRWKNYFGENDPYSSHETIGISDVLKAHFLVGDFFCKKGDGILDVGPRDPNLLHSAVYRQFTAYGGHDKWCNPYEKCATLVFGINNDHVFFDANKRTSLLIMLYFLNRVNKHFHVKQKNIERLIIDIANNNLRGKRRKKYKNDPSDDPEIYYISEFIRKKSRNKNNIHHAITFRELNNRLREFNYCLDNPHKNYIDICRIERKKKYLFYGEEKESLTKINQIGFPGWKKQVGRGTVSKVRKSTKLTNDFGVDSETFFRGAEPLYSLISEYQGPLERLAHK